jgi:hypothetical protein
MFAVMATITKACQVAVGERKVRPLVQMLDVVNAFSLMVLAFALTSLAFVVIALQDFGTLVEPGRAAIKCSALVTGH